jgi:hypothetical protein
MARGKRRATTPFYQTPEVLFTAYVLKVLNRLGWPSFLDKQEKSGFVKAYVVYQLSTHVASIYQESLYEFRRIVLLTPSGKKFWKKLKASEIYTVKSENLQIADIEEFKTLGSLDRTWGVKVVHSLGKSLGKSWCNLDAYIFRLCWDRILQKEKKSTSPGYSKAFKEWHALHGWKYGMETSNHDRLMTRCIEDDAYVNKAYRKFGFNNYGDFLNTAPFSLRSRQAFQAIIKEHISSHLAELQGTQ